MSAVSVTSTIEAGVREANLAWHAGREHYFESVRLIAEHVQAVEAECRAAGVSFRSLFVEGAVLRFDFSREHANRFLAVAKLMNKCPQLAIGTHENQFPHDTNTLATLARLPIPNLQRHLERGEIKANMTRADAAALVAERVRRCTPKAAEIELLLMKARKLMKRVLMALPVERRRAEWRDLGEECDATEADRWG